MLVTLKPTRADVLKPSEFELEYQDLELRTSDDVTLRCYLLLQKKDVGYGGTWLDVPGSVSEDEVCCAVGARFRCSHISSSLLPARR